MSSYLGSALASDGLLDQARAMMARGYYEETVQFLKESESERAGSPTFDYLLGVAALESQMYSEALFALRRVVVRRPGDLGARIDLARAYFGIGDFENAKAQFLQLRELDPPPKAMAVIDNYLRAIKRKTVGTRPSFSGLLAFDLGFDSNANSATEITTFQGFDLREQSRSAESAFTGISGHGIYIRPFNGRWRMKLGAFGQARWFPDADFVNSREILGSTGLRYRSPQFSGSFDVSAGQRYLGGNENETKLNFDLAAERAINEDWRVHAKARYSNLRYPTSLDFRDVDAQLFALSGSRSLNLGLAGRWEGGVIAGRDAPSQPDSSYARDIAGAFGKMFVTINRSWQWSAETSFLVSDYANPFNGEDRRDRIWSLHMKFNYRLLQYPGWVISQHIGLVDNVSDVDLFAYERFIAGVQIRRLFE